MDGKLSTNFVELNKRTNIACDFNFIRIHFRIFLSQRTYIHIDQNIVTWVSGRTHFLLKMNLATGDLRQNLYTSQNSLPCFKLTDNIFPSHQRPMSTECCWCVNLTSESVRPPSKVICHIQSNLRFFEIMSFFPLTYLHQKNVADRFQFF